MKNYNSSENPEFFNEYLVHIKITKLLADRTIQEYFTDVRLFLRYIYGKNHDTEQNIEEIDIRDMTEDELKKITVSDIYNFIYYTSNDRKNKDRARYRKVSSLRSFFKYLEKVAHIIDKNPTKDLDVATPKPSLPKFLSLNESLRLLETADSADSKRDYCIITLFLN